MPLPSCEDLSKVYQNLAECEYRNPTECSPHARRYLPLLARWVLRSQFVILTFGRHSKLKITKTTNLNHERSSVDGAGVEPAVATRLQIKKLLALPSREGLSRPYPLRASRVAGVKQCNLIRKMSKTVKAAMLGRGVFLAKKQTKKPLN